MKLFNIHDNHTYHLFLICLILSISQRNDSTFHSNIFLGWLYQTIIGRVCRRIHITLHPQCQN